jgi:hypothetical protein
MGPHPRSGVLSTRQGPQGRREGETWRVRQREPAASGMTRLWCMRMCMAYVQRASLTRAAWDNHRYGLICHRVRVESGAGRVRAAIVERPMLEGLAHGRTRHALPHAARRDAPGNSIVRGAWRKGARSRMPHKPDTFNAAESSESKTSTTW